MIAGLPKVSSAFAHHRHQLALLVTPHFPQLIFRETLKRLPSFRIINPVGPTLG